MTDASGTQTTFIVGDRTFAVRVDRDQTPRSVTVTVTVDGRFEWVFDEPGWRPLSFGAGAGRPYLWSARELIILSRSARDEPEVLKVDEDLLFVFSVGAGWLLVCETSVRLVASGIESARLNLGDVVEHAAWDRDLLVVRDSAGAEYRVRVDGDRLISWMSDVPVLIDGDYGAGAYGPTILLELRSAEATDLLLSVLGSLAVAAPRTEVQLDRVPGVALGASIMRLVLRAVDAPPDRHLIRDGAGGFLWSGTAEDWETARLLVEPLRRQPGHQYLTSETEDDALVEVSSGER